MVWKCNSPLPQGKPQRVFSVMGAGLPDLFAEAAVTCAELDKSDLCLGQAAAICAAGVEGEKQLRYVFFPEADGADF